MNDDIRIAEITLVNYRQYYGIVKISFPRNRSAFSIIIGGNGYGKSNLWNAIHWCLFNNEPHLKSRNTSIINNKYVREKHKNKMIMSVEIIMESGSTKYRVRRQMEGLLHDLEYDESGVLKISKEDPVPVGFEIINKDKSTLFQKSENGGVWTTESDRRNFRGLVNRHIIPENLSHFFILDGEFLQELFDRFEDIESGINQISQINVLNYTLSMVETARFPKPKKMGSDAETIEKSIERHMHYLNSEDNRGRLQKSSTDYVYGTEDTMHAWGLPRQTDLEQSTRNIEKRLREIKREKRESNAEVKMALKDQYEEQRKHVKTIESLIREAEGSYRKLLVQSGPQMLCKKSIKRATILIKDEMDKGELPNISKRMFVGDMLSKESCLCGNSLEKGTDARKIVEEELERITGDIRYDIADRIRFHNEKFLENYEHDVARIDSYMEKIQKLNMDLSESKEKLKEIESKMPDEAEDYSTLIAEENSLERRKNDEFVQLGEENRAIADHSRDRGDDVRRLKHVKAKGDDERRYMLLQEKSAIVQSALREAAGHVAENIRRNVSKETLDIFNSLHWKRDYANLSIDSKYVIRVTREDGFDLAGSMSAGEKLFLALSFIMALKKITNYKFPFIIDSPLGKIAGELRESFGMHMPDMLNGSQLIMLATNSEYTRDKIELEDGSKSKYNLEELFERKVKVHEYKINHNEMEELSTIQKLGGRRIG